MIVYVKIQWDLQKTTRINNKFKKFVGYKTNQSLNFKDIIYNMKYGEINLIDVKNLCTENYKTRDKLKKT